MYDIFLHNSIKQLQMTAFQINSVLVSGNLPCTGSGTLRLKKQANCSRIPKFMTHLKTKRYLHGTWHQDR